MTLDQDFILILDRHVGQANAIPAKQLADELCINDRELRDLRDRMEDTYPVLSDYRHGYWRAASYEEYDIPLKQDKAISSSARYRHDRRVKCRNMLWPNYQPRMF